MANEWTKVELNGANNDGAPRTYIIADGTSVSKGTLLRLTDPRTVVAVSASGQAPAGVASEEHLANEGITRISCWTDGIFSVKASSAIEAGMEVMNDIAPNCVTVVTVAALASGAFAVLGKALDTASADEIINVRLGPL